MNNNHPIKLIYKKFTLLYSRGRRTIMNGKEGLKKAIIECYIFVTLFNKKNIIYHTKELKNIL